jgi:cbb3-type cytochrome oxidase cytochrome c subunit
MKGIVPLFLGIFGTFAFSWAGLVLIPNYQIGHLDPQVEEEDVYPAPKSGMADRGRKLYAANGCVYCHSQQVRADYAGSDIDRKWGVRRSAPRDYLFERPVVLGKMRLGPDLANIGKRAPAEEGSAPATGSPTPAAPTAAQGSPTPGASPSMPPGATVSASPATSSATATPPASATTAAASPSPAANAPSLAGPTELSNSNPPAYSAAWHHRHLYRPRSLVLDSNMPNYHFLYEKRRISGQRAADALNLGEQDGVPEGWEVVPTYDAKCIVAYLMSLDQSHPLKEVKAASAPAPASSAPAKEAK